MNFPYGKSPNIAMAEKVQYNGGIRGNVLGVQAVDAEEVYRKFKETRQEAVRLDMALKGFFSESCPQKSYQEEYGRYLKQRIRPAVEVLIRNDDVEKIEALEKQGWFGEQELDRFIRTASQQGKTLVLMWLMHLKNNKYGFKEKDFSL